MKLSDYAKKLGVTYRTAWSMFKRGDIQGAYALPTGTIIVPNGIEKENVKNDTIQVCIYARVSSSQNKNNLNSQSERLQQYCIAKGWKIKKIVKEIGSGINDHRTKLSNIIKNIDDYDYVVIEHKDRLTIVGFNYFELFYPDKFHVVNEANEITEDLIQDLLSIITSFYARLYGQRKGKRKTEKLIKELQNDS